MGNIFKSLARGVLYFLAFPGIIIAIAIYAVFGVAVFIFQFGKLIYLFFTGRTLFSDLPEDIEVKRIIESRTVQPSEELMEAPQEEQDPFLSPIYQNDYSFPFKTADKEEKEEENIQEAPSKDESEVEKQEEGGNEDA
jgi:hypothetical protein